jgi:hypothetical protein
MDDRYGVQRSQSVTDVEWIHDAAARGEVLVCKDRRMAKRPLEAEAIYYAEAKVLILASAQITGPEMRARLLGNADAIERLANVQGPWVFGVYADRIDRIRLNHP